MQRAKTEYESAQPFLQGHLQEEDDDIENTVSTATRINSIDSFQKSFHMPQQPDNSVHLYNSKARCSWTKLFLTWIPWMVISILQVVIICLLLQPLAHSKGDGYIWSGREGLVETGDDINGLYKTCELLMPFICINSC